MGLWMATFYGSSASYTHTQLQGASVTINLLSETTTPLIMKQIQVNSDSQKSAVF